MLSTVSADSLRCLRGDVHGRREWQQGDLPDHARPPDGRVVERPSLPPRPQIRRLLEIHPSGKFLYAVSEAGRSGRVFAYAVSPDTGDLTLLNEASSGGSGPCHVNVDHAGKFVLVANYGSGSAAVIPIRPDGGLGDADRFRPARGLQRESFASEGAACPFGQSQPGRPIRLRGRPRARQDHDLQARRPERHDHRQRSAASPRSNPGPGRGILPFIPTASTPT